MELGLKAEAIPTHKFVHREPFEDFIQHDVVLKNGAQYKGKDKKYHKRLNELGALKVLYASPADVYGQPGQMLCMVYKDICRYDLTIVVANA